MLAAVAALYASISLYYAVDAAVSIHHALNCPANDNVEMVQDMREVIAKVGRRGEIALYLLIVGLALVLWPLFIAIKILVRSKE